MRSNGYTGSVVNIRMSKMSPTVQRELLARWDDYAWERDRQEQELEGHTMGYAADEQLHKDRGGKMPITFKDWLKGQGKGPRQMAEEEAFKGQKPSHDIYTPDPNAWGTPEENNAAPPW